MFWTYVLENRQSRFYIGHTEQLDIRLAAGVVGENGPSWTSPCSIPWRVTVALARLRRFERNAPNPFLSTERVRRTLPGAYDSNPLRRG